MCISKVIAAIIGIVILDSVALMNGINGTYMTLAFVAIAGLGGYEIRDVVDMLKTRLPPPGTLPSKI
jgi:hypothetical protein